MPLRATVDRTRTATISLAAAAVLYLLWLTADRAVIFAGEPLYRHDIGSNLHARAAATEELPVYRFWQGTIGEAVMASEGTTLDVNSVDAPLLPSIVKGPYLLWPTQGSMTVVWQTDLATKSRIEYGLATSGEFYMADLNSVTLHQMTLVGLEPNTTYSFMVTSGVVPGPTSTFVAAPAADHSFRFAVYGDTGTSSGRHAIVAQSIMKSQPAIVFHAGDLVGIGRDYWNWESDFFEPAYGLMLTTPIVPVLGNHEYFGTEPLWFPYFFAPPSTGGWWAMTYGNVRFIGLNTNRDYAPGSKQGDWLLAELQSSEFAQAVWRIVIFHHPPYTCTSVHDDDTSVQSHLVPLFDQYGVHMVFSGHSHAYERYSQRGITYIVTGGGGAPLYELVEDTIPPIRQFGASRHHHCVVDVNVPDMTLRLKAVDPNGEVFDTIEVDPNRSIP